MVVVPLYNNRTLTETTVCGGVSVATPHTGQLWLSATSQCPQTSGPRVISPRERLEFEL